MAVSSRSQQLIRAHRARLHRMSDVLTRLLLAEFAKLEAYDQDAADAYRAALFGRVGSASTAAVRQTAGYADQLGREVNVPMGGKVPDLLVRDKQARLTDPFNAFGRAMAEGVAFDEAVTRARSVVESLGSDIIHGSARQAMGFLAEGADTKWVRALGPNACDWCVALSRIEWDSPAAATFGHDNCSCEPVPATVGHAANRDELGSHSRSGDADVEYDTRSQRANLAAARSTANKNRRRWESELASETNSGRRARIKARIADCRAQAEWADARIDQLDR